MHPRLSVSEMCTYPWTFADELELWDDLGVRHVGVMRNKLDAFGLDAAVAELRKRSLTATTVIAGGFDLSDPGSWGRSRAALDTAADLAAEIGGCVYFTPGKRDGRSFDELAASLAEAVAPCVEHADSIGVRLAIEPTLMTAHSFVHNLRDAIDVVDRAGIGVVADLGGAWPERDYEDAVREAGARIAIVQLADASLSADPNRGRVPIGDGELDVRGFVQAALDAGYEGAFEIEINSRAVEAEGHAPALHRSVDRLNALLADVLP